MREYGNKRYISVWMATIIFMIFMVGCLIFIFYIRSHSEAEMRNYLEDVSSQRKAAIYQQMNSDFQVLDGVATSFGEMDLDDADSILNVLNDINKGNSFIRMGIADLKGDVDLVDLDGKIHRGYDISSLDAFSEVLKGNHSVSETFYEADSGEDVNYYMVPIYKGERMDSILCAVESGNILKELLDVRVFQNEGYFGIVDSQGILVAPTVDPNPEVKIGASIFDLADMSEKQESQVHSVLVNGEAQKFIVPVFGNENLAVLQPLDINNWTVVSVVPRDSLNTYFNQTAIGVAILVAIISIFFIGLLVWQIRSTGRYQERLESLAYTDQLTCLRNYRKFYIDAQQLIETKHLKKYAIWSMDIKTFNTINDIFGNAAGDQLLKFIGAFLKKQEDMNNFAARTSADDFIGIYEYSQKEDIVHMFEALKNEIFKRDIIPESEKKIDFAMGFYCFEDFDEVPSVEEMANMATIAEKNAKSLLGSNMMFFTREMQDDLHWKILLEAQAQDALDKGEITFVLQPKVKIREQFVVAGAEVLARWNHSEYGLISPGDFIPLFEENGFIVTFDRYIFRKACQWLVEFQKKYHLPLKIAVNVSRQGLLREDIISYYSGIKNELGIGDGILELEFTESIVFDDYELFKNTVIGLQDAGFMCSIDDFGAGYSSMDVLKSLPIDVLKLDAIFMENEGNVERGKILLNGFIALAHELCIITVAEGVETEEQVRYLIEANCDIVQGYVFSKPLPPSEFEEYISKNNGEVNV